VSVEENKKSCYRCFEEIWNQGDYSVIPEVISPDYVGGDIKGLDGFEQMVKNSRSTMPDLHYTVDEVVGEGETLMLKLSLTGTYSGKVANMDIEGKPLNISFVLVNRYKDGKCIEATSFVNVLDYLQQLGVPIPPEWGIG
jgi:predicted ester cyclase